MQKTDNQKVKSVVLDEKVHRAAKGKSVQLGTTLKNYVTELIKKDVQKAS